MELAVKVWPMARADGIGLIELASQIFIWLQSGVTAPTSAALEGKRLVSELQQE